MHKITMLGAGLIGRFYTQALHGNRSRDRVEVLYSRSPERAREAASNWGVARWTDDLARAIEDPATDLVVVGLPNSRHMEAVLAAARAGKAVLCTKPLGTNPRDALAMLEAVEKAGVFHGYLEDLVYSPKVAELGYTAMFSRMLDALDAGRQPEETFYDGYVVNAIVEACYRSARSKRWEPVALEVLKNKGSGRIVERIG